MVVRRTCIKLIRFASLILPNSPNSGFSRKSHQLLRSGPGLIYPHSGTFISLCYTLHYLQALSLLGYFALVLGLDLSLIYVGSLKAGSWLDNSIDAYVPSRFSMYSLPGGCTRTSWVGCPEERTRLHISVVHAYLLSSELFLLISSGFGLFVWL